MTEPNFTQQIPSNTVCNWFYFFFALNAFVFGLLVLSVVYITVTSTKGLSGAMKMDVFRAFIGLILAGTNMLFFYIMCARALKPVA
jgi:hypothetical protein